MNTQGVLVILCLIGLPFLLGVTEINIGQNNTVITGGVSGSDGCLEGNGATKSEKRKVDTFRGVVSDGPFEIKIQSGKKTEVRVSADSNLLDLIATRVNGDLLEVKATRSFCTTNPVKLDISLPELNTLTALGSSDINLDCSSSSSVEIVLKGSTTLNATGTVDTLLADLGDSSDMDGSGLKARTVKIEASGSSGAQVFATEMISGRSRDASDVVYHGNPKKVEVSAQDASDFEPAD